MTSYGFLFYGPGSYVWYQTLDRYLPQPTVMNLMTKVLFSELSVILFLAATFVSYILMLYQCLDFCHCSGWHAFSLMDRSRPVTYLSEVEN